MSSFSKLALIFALLLLSSNPAFAQETSAPNSCILTQLDIGEIIEDDLMDGLEDEKWNVRVNTQNGILELLICVTHGSGPSCKDMRDVITAIIERLRELQGQRTSPEARARIEQIILALIKEYRDLCPRPPGMIPDPTFFPAPGFEDDIPMIPDPDPYDNPYDY